MARNLSWIDSEKLASLLDVVSPAPRQERHGAGEDPSEATVDSALFAATYTSVSLREAPAATPSVPERVAPVARPAPAETAAPQRAAAPARPPAVAASPAPAPVVMPAPAPTAAAAIAAQPAAVAFQPDPHGDLGARLEAFLDWVVPATRSRGVLITDANGLVVIERHALDLEPAITASVDMMLNHMADVVQSQLEGYVAFHHHGLHLVTLWTPTEYGRFFGVLIGETAPPQESIALAGQGLRTLFAN
jgi:hypothetical protein